MQKLLTIIIPTYNMQKYLHDCLDSLIVPEQQMDLLEVIVVNDGSKDKSSEIAHDFANKYPQTFHVMDKENGNYGSCINKGLQIATGRYVKVLDADDSFDTVHFEDYLLFLSTVDADMVITPYTVVNEEGRIRSCEKYDLPTNTLLSWQQLTPAFKKKSLQMHAVTYKLQNLKEIHYQQTEGISYTDQEWIFTPLTAVNTAIAYPDTIYKYLVGRAGQTICADVMKRNISHNEQCARRIIKDYKSFKSFEPSKQEYIDYKFLVTLSAMYFWYLLRYPDLDLRQLVRFDDFVKSVDEAYIDLLDAQSIKYTHYYYIEQWHKNRAKRDRISGVCYLCSRIIDRFCNICRKD